MWDTNGAKYKHFTYNLNWAKKKSGDKYKKALDWYILVLKKEEKGLTPKWVEKTKPKVLARLKKYGIKEDKIKEAFERKGLKSLLKLI